MSKFYAYFPFQPWNIHWSMSVSENWGVFLVPPQAATRKKKDRSIHKYLEIIPWYISKKRVCCQWRKEWNSSVKSHPKLPLRTQPCQTARLQLTHNINRSSLLILQYSGSVVWLSSAGMRGSGFVQIPTAFWDHQEGECQLVKAKKSKRENDTPPSSEILINTVLG